MTRTIATTAAALVAAGGFWITAGMNAEASSSNPHKARAHASQVHKTPKTPKAKNPHAGERCASYSYSVPRGKGRSCTRYVKR